MNGTWITVLASVLGALIHIVFILRVMLRPHREPASRIAWLAVIIALPIFGVIVYIFLGETSIGRKGTDRRRKIVSVLKSMPTSLEAGNLNIPIEYRYLFDAGKTVNGFDVVDGNSGTLMKDSNATISSIVEDMDAAKDHIHLEFYIWLSDNNGLKVVEALKKAATRGVSCRAMADSLGSRAIIKSKYWKEMREAGVKLVNTLPIGNLLNRALHGRIDLRNHRKIVIIDNRITYCGSQNCADPEFRVKAKYAPWVDAMIRFEGPIVLENQYLFASDWMSEQDEDLRPYLDVTIPKVQKGMPAQVIGTGPTNRASAMPEIFEILMHAARKELTISTPYYVPDVPLQTALCASARRGVKTTIIFPARNDSFYTGAASRSNYADLLEAGVQIYEYVGGLLHTKSLTLDGQVTLIGSANMDRRSFELNYENNILFYDKELTADVRNRQEDYIKKSNPVSIESVNEWSIFRRLWNNFFALLGPVL